MIYMKKFIKKALLLLLPLTVLLTSCSNMNIEVHHGSDDSVSSKISKMSIDEKIYQMFVVRPEALTGSNTPIASIDSSYENLLKKYPVGGFIFFNDNLKDEETAENMIDTMQYYSQTGLIIGVDEEGGRVARAATKLGTTAFSPMYEYKNEGPMKIKEIYSTIGDDLDDIGFNVDFAPVADVWTNPDNKVIGTRAFSEDPNEVAACVKEAVKALQEEGVSAAIKHFPGHGDTADDSHTGMVYSSKTLDELRNCEFIPFKAGIDAGADFVMVGHIIVPAVDELPATLSHKWITEILRGELGYTGLVITDGMEMGALTENYSVPEASIKAIEAGCDILLLPADFTAATEAVKDAVKSGRISEDRIDESVSRILNYKKIHHIF